MRTNPDISTLRNGRNELAWAVDSAKTLVNAGGRTCSGVSVRALKAICMDDGLLSGTADRQFLNTWSKSLTSPLDLVFYRPFG